MEEDLEKKLIAHAIDPKTQIIRLIDVAVIAPIMIMAGLNKSLPKWKRISLLTFGVATLFYNLINFIKIKKLTEEFKKPQQ